MFVLLFTLTFVDYPSFNIIYLRKRGVGKNISYMNSNVAYVYVCVCVKRSCIMYEMY